MKNCMEKITPDVLCNMYWCASRKDADGGIPGKSPYVITKTYWWPLGFGFIEADHDDFEEGDWYWVTDPEKVYSESLDNYGKTWIIYNGPENEPFWSAIAEFQKVPLINVDIVEEDQRKEKLENYEDEFIAIETNELPF